MSDGGKGSSPRPFSVTQEQYASNWDAIFNKNKGVMAERPNAAAWKADGSDNGHEGSNPSDTAKKSCGNCGKCKCPK